MGRKAKTHGVTINLAFCREILLLEYCKGLCGLCVLCGKYFFGLRSEGVFFGGLFVGGEEVRGFHGREAVAELFQLPLGRIKAPF